MRSKLSRLDVKGDKRHRSKNEARKNRGVTMLKTMTPDEISAHIGANVKTLPDAIAMLKVLAAALSSMMDND